MLYGYDFQEGVKNLLQKYPVSPAFLHFCVTLFVLACASSLANPVMGSLLTPAVQLLRAT